MGKNKSSEGEEFIKDFLESEDIKFRPEEKIEDLKGDDSSYRVADFYLPQYKVYVEFFGQWNVSEEHKKRYNKKKRVYRENKIPCVYLYPENLGILKFLLKRRIKDVLKSQDMKWQLFKINWEIFKEENGLIALIILGILIYYINNLIGRIVLSLLFIGVIYERLKKSFLK